MDDTSYLVKVYSDKDRYNYYRRDDHRANVIFFKRCFIDLEEYRNNKIDEILK